MPLDVKEFHEKELDKFSLPDFVKDLDCPYCKEKLTKSSIREIGMSFNTRNLGDIFVQFCCDKCSQMNTLYYRQQAESIHDFKKILDGTTTPSVNPVIEEEMFQLKYNNLTEKMLAKIQNGSNLCQ